MDFFALNLAESMLSV